MPSHRGLGRAINISALCDHCLNARAKVGLAHGEAIRQRLCSTTAHLPSTAGVPFRHLSRENIDHLELCPRPSPRRTYGSPTGKSCSVFVSCVTCVRSCARVIRGTRGLRRSRVLLLLLLLPPIGPRGCPVVVPWVVPWFSRGCPTCSPNLLISRRLVL